MVVLILGYALGWVAFKLLVDLVGLMMDLLGKRFLPRGSLALFDFQTIEVHFSWS